MSVKMVADFRKVNRKRAARRRHRQKNWWNVGDVAKVEHLYSCKECYEWVMGQINDSNVKYGYNEWLTGWRPNPDLQVHINYRKSGEEIE